MLVQQTLRIVYTLVITTRNKIQHIFIISERLFGQLHLPSSLPDLFINGYIQIILVFIWISYEWNQSVFALLSLASFAQYIVSENHLLLGVSMVCSFSLLNSIPLYKYGIFGSSNIYYEDFFSSTELLWQSSRMSSDGLCVSLLIDSLFYSIDL